MSLATVTVRLTAPADEVALTPVMDFPATDLSGFGGSLSTQIETTGVVIIVSEAMNVYAPIIFR